MGLCPAIDNLLSHRYFCTAANLVGEIFEKYIASFQGENCSPLFVFCAKSRFMHCSYRCYLGQLSVKDGPLGKPELSKYGIFIPYIAGKLWNTH